jgi:hypothetical protein
MWRIQTTRRSRFIVFLFPAAVLFAQLLLLSQQEQRQQQQQQREFGGSYDPPVLSSIPAKAVLSSVVQVDLERNKISSSTSAADGIPKILSQNETIHHDDDDDDHSSLLSNAFIQKLAANLSRVWPHKPLSFWCLQQPVLNKSNSNSNSNSNSTTIPSNVSSSMMLQSTTHPEGLLLVKVPKSASSTVTGVILRIQDRHHCDLTEWKHLAGYHYANRVQARSFLVAPIRQPATRALSNLFFHDVSFHGQRPRPPRKRKPPPPQLLNSTASAAAAVEAAASSVDIVPSDSHIRNGLLRATPNFILQYTSLIHPPQPPPPPPQEDKEAAPKRQRKRKQHPPQKEHWNFANASLAVLQEHVVSVIDGYDFLIVVDRLPESLVVMALLTGLHVTDLLTMSSKQAGMWYYTGRECIALARPVQSAATRALFQSPEWKRAHVGDELLHATAVQSLDRTIQALGVAKVQQAVADLKQWQDRVEQACGNVGAAANSNNNNNETQYPCSATGEPQLDLAAASCYTRDFGCGHFCVDRIVDAAS